MELIQIVDKNGNFTGEIIEKEKAHDKNLLHNEVAAFVVNKKGKILLQKRSANKRFDANKWAICAGHVDAYESLENAMLREINEEIGIEITPNELLPLGDRKITLSDSNSHITYYYYIYSNLNEDEFIIQRNELSEVKWFDLDKVIQIIQSKDQTIVFKEDSLKYFEQLKKIIKD